MRLPSLLKSRSATVLWCGPNSRTSPALTTYAFLAAEAATAPLARCCARCSIQRPLWLSSSAAVPSALRRSRRPSSPPLMKPSPAGSPIRHRTAPPCTGGRASGAAAVISAGSRRTEPSPKAKAAIVPSRLKAQAATGASLLTDREGGSAWRQAGLARSSFTRLFQAVFETALEVLAVEIAADEDELAGARLAVLPRRAPVAVHHHVHALKDVAARGAVDGEDALAAEDVGTAQLQERAHPFLEPLRHDRPVGRERQTRDLLFVVVIVAVAEEIRLELQDAPEVERALVEDGVELDLARLRAVQPRQGIDRADLVLDRLELFVAHQVGLVKQDHVGEGDLFLGFVALLELAEEMLGVDHGDDGVEPGLGAHFVVGEESLRHRARIGQPRGLDQDAVELLLALHQAFDDAYEIAAHRAADAAVVHLEHFLVGVDHEVVVDAEFAELVDDHGVRLAVLLAQDAVEQGGLAGAEIAGQHRHGHLRLSHWDPRNSAPEIGWRRA